MAVYSSSPGEIEHWKPWGKLALHLLSHLQDASTAANSAQGQRSESCVEGAERQIQHKVSFVEALGKKARGYVPGFSTRAAGNGTEELKG
jgi:hypothetical protein